MKYIYIFLEVVGSTGLLLYGMKLIGESIQKIAGERFRDMLSSMSSNRFWGLLAGIIITALVQSSLVTSVMMVNFVNAGIIRLADAIAIIMGANIGTTVTAWIISLIGFQFNITWIALPLIGVSVPFLFSSNRKFRVWGELFFGFSLLIISMLCLRESVPVMSDSWIGDAINFISSWGGLSYPVFFLIGILFTALIKSSNAIFALTLVFCMGGWINFEQAALMVLGENVGTTLSAMIASAKVNGTAKRAAFAHFFFNLFGVIWALQLFPRFSHLSGKLLQLLGGNDPFVDKNAIPLALALFHTLFNTLNTLVLFPFIGLFKKLIIKVVPVVSMDRSYFKFNHIKVGLLSTPEVSLYQAKMETVGFAERVRKMFRNIEKLIESRDEKEIAELEKVAAGDEEYSNRMEHEIAAYLTKVSEGRLSESNSRTLRSLYKMIDELESIADSCTNIVSSIKKHRDAKMVIPESVHNNIILMFNMVNEALDTMVTMLNHSEDLPISMAEKTEEEINNFRDILKSEYLSDLAKGIYNYDEGSIYNDIISQCERIGDYSINVVEAFKVQ